MNTTLHLTANERSIFDSLPSDLKNGWTVVEETLSSYETLAEIQIRYSLADFSFHPEMKMLAERIANGETPDKISLQGLAPAVQSELFFVLGARGINMMMQVLLPAISTDADVELLVTLSSIRHKHLELNSSVTAR